MSLGSERHSFSPNFVNLFNRNWSGPKVVQRKSHALSLLKMSLRSKRHWFSSNFVTKVLKEMNF
jgi:hypothetical protein